jgi:mono/diheme cytochrome c family protein
VDAFTRGSCNLCHDVPQVAAADRQSSCTGCHVWIRQVSATPAAREKALAAFPKWERYERNISTYLQVPSLQAALVRLDPSWVREYLADPHDLRPGLPETMPRLDLTAPELDAIASAFADAQQPIPKQPAPDPEKTAQGRSLFGEKACTTCHAFGARMPVPGVPMAPDLAHAKNRMDPDRAVAWILDPGSQSPEATMPSLGLSVDEALALRDYLWLADPGWEPAQAASTEISPHQGPVTWDQVEEAVFGKICAHCHMNPDMNAGRGGPGNEGGFGYAPTGIELQTLAGVRAVEPEVLARVLLDRRAENHRDTVAYGEAPASLTRPERPGMPLGLPALPDAELALVLAWIDQGRPE